MNEKKLIKREVLTGERALFGARNLEIHETIFDDGESPLKESANISLYDSMFKWKYPLWYTENVTAESCAWYDGARAGVWYTKNVSLQSCTIEAPKNFRRCKDLSLENVSFSNAAETLWHCEGVNIKNTVVSNADYFAMNSTDLIIDNLTLYGNYSFDGCENLTIRNSKLLTKDAFWNGKNITVYDSFISGEYLGWNSKDLTLINCTIESLQGLCYIDNLVMKNCKLINTTLAFEYSTVDVEVCGHIDSVINPEGGRISADSIGTLIIEKDKVDPSKTKIILSDKEIMHEV